MIIDTMKTDRKIHQVNASNLTEKQICELLNIRYVPWYKDSLFWSLALVFSAPTLILLFS